MLFTVGSEDEDGPHGMAHLLEHSLFNGTTNYSKNQLSEEFDKLCAKPNASTSADITEYKVKFPKFNLVKVAELFSDMIFNSSFNEEELSKEIGVIIEEIKMHQDHPLNACYDALIEAMYAGTGMGWEIAGEPKLLKKVTREDLIKFRNLHYTPENTIISVRGDVNREEVIALIERCFANRFAEINESNTKEKKWTEEVNNTPKTIISNKRNLKQSNVIMGCYVMGANSDPVQIKALGIVTYILGGSLSSRLFKKLRGELSYCYSIYASCCYYKNTGFMLIEFSTSPENKESAISAVKEEINKILTCGITEQEFEVAKNIKLNSFLMSLDSTPVNLEYVAYFNKLVNNDEIIEQIKALKKEQCEEVFKKFICNDNFFVSVVE